MPIPNCPNAVRVLIIEDGEVTFPRPSFAARNMYGWLMTHWRRWIKHNRRLLNLGCCVQEPNRADLIAGWPEYLKRECPALFKLSGGLNPMDFRDRQEPPGSDED